MRHSLQTQPALLLRVSVLDGVEALIDWDRIEAHLPRGEAHKQTGRPGYPAQTLFRALLLGLWYNLSDVRLSTQLARDLLFRKFCRLELDQGVPDDSTLGRFRARLGERLEAILDEIMTQLEAANVALAEGRIAVIDATVVEAAQSRISTADPEAGSRVKVNVKGKMQAVWGFQAFVNADEDGFIRRVAVTPGNHAEVNSLADLVVGDGRNFMQSPLISARAQGRFWCATRWLTECKHVAHAAIGWHLQKGARYRQNYG